MRGLAPTINIAAALIDDDCGRLLLVRKAGTSCFMQAGGKIEPGENVLAALCRELSEELGLNLVSLGARYLGRYCAPAAHEPQSLVVAELFHIRIAFTPRACAEIAEVIWVDPAHAEQLPLAPLTRDHVLPLARTL